ncbi:MAG: hypothetical protein DMF84_09135 [Acidobacteria bacterium]|nr:MAG: hypothetical protein DMF84_09135 [Acidobacteriota bacterium]
MPTTLSVYGMLLGYAIECALKGIWVLQGNKLVDNGAYVGISGTGEHDLLQLADRAGVDTSAAERSVLTRLSVFIRFAGRYPVARKAREMLPVHAPGKDRTDIDYMPLDEFDCAEGLFRRLTSVLQTHCE